MPTSKTRMWSETSLVEFLLSLLQLLPHFLQHGLFTIAPVEVQFIHALSGSPLVIPPAKWRTLGILNFSGRQFPSRLHRLKQMVEPQLTEPHWVPKDRGGGGTNGRRKPLQGVNIQRGALSFVWVSLLHSRWLRWQRKRKTQSYPVVKPKIKHLPGVPVVKMGLITPPPSSFMTETLGGNEGWNIWP